jgi:hypothetical protein
MHLHIATTEGNMGRDLMKMNKTLYNRTEAVARALATKTNVPDTCQLVTRTWVGAPSAGDFDGDGAADAEDGWKREPAAYKHFDLVFQL